MINSGEFMKSLNFVRSTKIVSTLGPATLDYNMIKSLMLSGVNVFRLNFSHGNHDNHQKTIEKIRSLEKELKFQIAILARISGWRRGDVGQFSPRHPRDILAPRA